MVGAFILKYMNNWTFEDLFENLYLHLGTRKALGLSELDEAPFCYATLFNFQGLLGDHYLETGENLLEQVFDKLTKEQLQKLKIKTDIQRTDSFLIGSNIRNYTRLQILIEMLIRLNRVIDGKRREELKDCFSPYVGQMFGAVHLSIKR